VDITYEKEKNGDTAFVGSFRHGANLDINKVVISCGPGCTLLAHAPEPTKHIAANRGGRPSNACPTNPGDLQWAIKCLTVRYLDLCDDQGKRPIDFPKIDWSVGCDATCWKCKSAIFTHLSTLPNT
jgi:hypothetical protein